VLTTAQRRLEVTACVLGIWILAQGRFVSFDRFVELVLLQQAVAAIVPSRAADPGVASALRHCKLGESIIEQRFFRSLVGERLGLAQLCGAAIEGQCTGIHASASTAIVCQRVIPALLGVGPIASHHLGV
jgi:hypothetical protein